MPMELRKRKAPANPPPPAPPKRTKSATGAKKKTVAEKATETAKNVKDVVVDSASAAATAATNAAAAATEAAASTATTATTAATTTTSKKAAPKKKGAAKEAKEAKETKDAAAEKVTAAAEEKKAEAAEAAPAAEPATTSAAPAKKGRGKAAAAKDTAKDAAAEVKADAKAAAKETKEAAPAKESAAPKLKVGDALPADLGEVTLHDGTKTTFGDLLKKSDKGIVLFSYTKANTPGCTSQACALRDSHAQFTSAGYSIYGLSGDSPADNTKFRTKQNLGYSLISDPSYAFHEKLGIKNAGKAAGVRSVVVVQKDGAIIKEHKGVSAKNSIDYAKKAVGIDTAAAAPGPSSAPAASDAQTTKTVAVGSSAPEADAATKA